MKVHFSLFTTKCLFKFAVIKHTPKQLHDMAIIELLQPHISDCGHFFVVVQEIHHASEIHQHYWSLVKLT